MADTFPVGSIPPFSVWEGETLSFKVTNRIGSGATFSKRATPSPKGKMAIDEKTGVFTYTPAAEDRDEVAVWIRARKGARDEKQKVFITPHPRLPSEFHVIEHVSKIPPDPASRLYITYAEEDAGEFRFNDIEEFGNESRANVMTKRVTVSGVRLVLESKGNRAWLYEKLKDRTTLKELTLCADEVVIGCELKLPGTDVRIYARSLRFDDSGGAIARIDTSPLPVRSTATRDEGLNGQKAGDVYLFVNSLETPGSAVRIIANGSDGQKARRGQKGKDGDSVTPWNGKIRVENKDFDFSQELKKLPAKGFPETPVKVGVFQEIQFLDRKAPGGLRTKLEARAHYDLGSWPTSGTDPKIYPGRPGQGGDGGSITTAFKEQLESRVRNEPGKQGEMAEYIPATKPGQPQQSLMLRFVYRMDIRGATTARFGQYDARETKPGNDAKALPASALPPKKGQFHSPTQGGTSFWLHPATVRALTAYANDARLAGHAQKVLGLLQTYLDAVKVAADARKAELEWPVLHSELTALLQRLNGPYDYFGNPAGWVPMLSFQANLQLYKNELDSAIRTMFLAYWVENHQQRARKAESVLKESMQRLRNETQQALDDYEAAQVKLRRLDEQVEDIKKEIGERKRDLEALIKRLKQEVKDNLRVEHFWRSAAKIVGGAMQLIPVGQPVLGAFGKSFSVLSDIDLDNPTGSLGDLAGAWSTVASDKIAPKFSKLFEGMKSAKKDEEEKDEKKEKFEKEVAKKELEQKVKTHLEAQKKAKDSIVEAFSGFAVSEDDIKERLEQALAQSPDFKKLGGEIESLNARKAVFAGELLAALQAIDVATTTILKNQMALIELRGQLDTTLDKLNVEALQYVRDMGQRARDRLLMYQYYLLKSYHYLTLEELPGLDFRAQKLFDSFSNLLAESPNGMLTNEQYKSLGVLFENDLKEIARKIIAFYQAHKGRQTGSFLLDLRDQLETLNSPAKRVEVDLMWKLDRQREDIRITTIETESIRLAEPLPTRVANLGLEYRHDGLSRVRRGGKLFLFRSGEFRVAGEGGAAPQAETKRAKSLAGSSREARSDKIYWSTDVSYNPRPREGQKELAWVDAKEDVEAESLVRYLIDAKGDDNPMLSFRPSAWTKLTIRRSGDFTGKLSDLTLKVNYVYYSVNDDILCTVVVKVADDAQPLISCDVDDVNERSDGQGSFIRTFDHTKRRRVTLRAPTQYGRRAFVGWRIGEPEEGEDGAVRVEDSSKLKRDPALTLNVKEVRDHLVEPVYEATEFVPVDDKDEPWPPCPTGWGFEDWILVNRSPAKDPIAFDKLDYVPWRGGAGYQPAVNEPLGNNQIKLSFERISLMTGESTKISVSPNPEVQGSAGDQIMFMWKEGYGVFFDGNGALSGLKKWKNSGWVDAKRAFELDKENRTLSFLG